MAKDHKPSMQFYPGDWAKDAELRSISSAARGLWIDMICFMFEGERRGYLQHSTGAQITPEQLARMTGNSPRDVKAWLVEMETVGVFSRAETGTIYCRRMVRDEALRKVRTECGKLGGNPNILDKQNKDDGSNLLNQTSNQIPTPSSSSSSSSSSSPSGEERAATPPPPPPRLEKPLPTDPLEKFEPLSDCFTEFIQQVAGRYPSARLPGSGTAEWFKWRRDLADLHVLDGFTVQRIGEVLEWLWQSPDRDADFWRGNVQSIPALRKRKTGDALSKFGKIHAAWRNTQPGPQRNGFSNSRSPIPDPFPAMRRKEQELEQEEREREQQKTLSQS